MVPLYIQATCHHHANVDFLFLHRIHVTRPFEPPSQGSRSTTTASELGGRTLTSSPQAHASRPWLPSCAGPPAHTQRNPLSVVRGVRRQTKPAQPPGRTRVEALQGRPRLVHRLEPGRLARHAGGLSPLPRPLTSPPASLRIFPNTLTDVRTPTAAHPPPPPPAGTAPPARATLSSTSI